MIIKKFLLSTVIVGSLMASVSTSANQITTKIFKEDFKNGHNEARWTFGPATEALEEKDSQKSYLQWDSFPDGTWSPQLWTQASESEFLGNYRTKGVIQLAAEAQWFDKYIIFPEDNRPLSLMLVSGNYAAIKLSDESLRSSIGKWHTFNFSVPAPTENFNNTGWKVVQWPEFGVEAESSHFEEILKNVQQVRFYYADATRMYIIVNFKVGVSNISIETKN